MSLSKSLRLLSAALLGVVLAATPAAACTTQTYIINGQVYVCMICLNGRYIDCW